MRTGMRPDQAIIKSATQLVDSNVKNTHNMLVNEHTKDLSSTFLLEKNN